MTSFETSGRFFDGRSAKSRDVAVEISEQRVRIDTDRGPVIWAIEDVRSLDDQARDKGMVIEQAGEDEARLVLPDPTAAQYLKSVAPNLQHRPVSRKMWRRVAYWGGGAIASVVLILFVIIPLLANTLARYIPVEREIAMGNFAISQIESLFVNTADDQSTTCSSERGQAALDKMVARLTPHFDNPYPTSVRVMRSKQVNAFAVPGGHVVLFEGLLKEASTPEEVAGVLGHEFGHVVNRDPTRLGLRAAGSAGVLGLVFGDFAGGFAALALAEAMISADYSQDAEAKADEFSHALFARAGLPASRLGDFFARLEAEHGDVEGIVSHLVSHPNLKGRQAAAKAADVIGEDEFKPVLSSLEFAALKRICVDD